MTQDGGGAQNHQHVVQHGDDGGDAVAHRVLGFAEGDGDVDQDADGGYADGDAGGLDGGVGEATLRVDGAHLGNVQGGRVLRELDFQQAAAGVVDGQRQAPQ